MGLSHRLLGAGVLLILLVAVGCASKTRSRPRNPVSPVASHPAVRGGDDVPGARADDRRATAEEVTPDALAHHADAYARNVEALLRQRAEAAALERARAAAESPKSQSQAQQPSPSDEAPLAREASTPVGKQGEAPAEKAVQSAERAGEPTASAEVVANAPMNIDAAPAPAGEAQPAAATNPSFPQSATSRRLVVDPPSSRGAETAGLRVSKQTAASAVSTAADDLLQKLTARVRDYPRDAGAHLEYQLLQFLRDEPVPDLGAIAALPSEDRELLTTLLDGLSNFRNGLRADANMLQSKKVSPLLELSDRLRAQGELSIPVAALCSDVKLFGVYEPMEPARFVAGGKENRAILYFEVANFSSQFNGERKYETRLKQEAVLYAEAGLAVWRDKVDTVVDQSRNRRQDFFIADRVHLPETLPIGRYLLKVTVTDLHVNRVAEATVPVEIVAK